MPWGRILMGMFKVSVNVANPADPKRFFNEEFWVDTGAIYSFVPEDRLEAIGLIPLRTRDLILADGRQDRRLLGEARSVCPSLKKHSPARWFLPRKARCICLARRLWKASAWTSIPPRGGLNRFLASSAGSWDREKHRILKGTDVGVAVALPPQQRVISVLPHRPFAPPIVSRVHSRRRCRWPRQLAGHNLATNRIGPWSKSAAAALAMTMSRGGPGRPSSSRRMIAAHSPPVPKRASPPGPPIQGRNRPDSSRNV